MAETNLFQSSYFQGIFSVPFGRIFKTKKYWAFGKLVARGILWDVSLIIKIGGTFLNCQNGKGYLFILKIGESS